METILVRVEGIEKKLDERARQCEDDRKEIWVEIGRLRDNHSSHDKDLVRLAVSIENMVKEFSAQRQDMLQSIERNNAALSAHLKDEESDRKETIKAIHGLGWKVMATVIGGGVTLLATALSGILKAGGAG